MTEGFLMIPEGTHSWNSPFIRGEEFDFQNVSQIWPQVGHFFSKKERGW